MPGRICAFASDPKRAPEVAQFFRECGVYIIGTGSFSGLIYIQCPVGEEFLWLELARVHPLVRAAARDTFGEAGFGVPPSEMLQAGEPSGNLHDLYFLQNVGQTIDENSNGGSMPITGTPGADINAIGAWGITQGSSDIVVAVFDSGVDFEHPEFVGGRIHSSGGYSLTCPSAPGGSQNCCTGTPLVCTFGPAIDNHGHGSSVASVLGANADNGVPTVLNEEQYVGIDPNCTIFPVRISYDNNVFVGAVLQALEEIYFLDEPPDVVPQIINMSFTFGPENLQDPTKQALRAALDSLKYNDIIVVSMSGKGGDADLITPGMWNNTITVSATDPNDSRLSFDGGVTFQTSAGECVDFAAPGWGMAAAICPSARGCDPAYASNGFYSGTSASVPLVCGTVSLMFAHADALNITLTWDDVYDLLRYGADPTLLLPRTDEFGWGRIDAYLSLDAM